MLRRARRRSRGSNRLSTPAPPEVFATLTDSNPRPRTVQAPILGVSTQSLTPLFPKDPPLVHQQTLMASKDAQR